MEGYQPERFHTQHPTTTKQCNEMAFSQKYHVGQRVSFDSLGTIRYIGPVDGAGAKKEWLGIEWDNSERGKHNGVLKGKRYFTCNLLLDDFGACINLITLRLKFFRNNSIIHQIQPRLRLRTHLHRSCP